MKLKKNQGLYQVLNSKERKKITALVESQWGADFKTDLVFLRNQKDKIFLTNRDFESLPLDELRLEKMGLYFGMIEKDQLRLSIDASQIIGPLATKNIVEISEPQAKSWLHGSDLNITFDCSHFIILKHNNDFLGTGKPKGDTVLNFIPKNRRILVE